MNFKLSYTVSLFSMDIQKHEAVQMRLAMYDLLPSRLVRFITKVRGAFILTVYVNNFVAMFFQSD